MRELTLLFGATFKNVRECNLSQIDVLRRRIFV